MKVLPSRVVLKSHSISAFEAAARSARAVQSLSLPHDPHRLGFLLLLLRRYHLLCTSASVVCPHRAKEKLASLVLQPHGRKASQGTLICKKKKHLC